MLGAIIGDVVGSRFEFNPTNDFDFELLQMSAVLQMTPSAKV